VGAGMGVGGLKTGNGQLVFNGYRLSVWEDKVLEKNGIHGCRTISIHLVPLNCTHEVVMYVIPQ
jgi:hypothetical protein